MKRRQKVFRISLFLLFSGAVALLCLAVIRLAELEKKVGDDSAVTDEPDPVGEEGQERSWLDYAVAVLAGVAALVLAVSFFSRKRYRVSAQTLLGLTGVFLAAIGTLFFTDEFLDLDTVLVELGVFVVFTGIMVVAILGLYHGHVRGRRQEEMTERLAKEAGVEFKDERGNRLTRDQVLSKIIRAMEQGSSELHHLKWRENVRKWAFPVAVAILVLAAVIALWVGLGGRSQSNPSPTQPPPDDDDAPPPPGEEEYSRKHLVVTTGAGVPVLFMLFFGLSYYRLVRVDRPFNVVVGGLLAVSLFFCSIALLAGARVRQARSTEGGLQVFLDVSGLVFALLLAVYVGTLVGGLPRELRYCWEEAQ
ncbi:unnamed protein product [Durusdinium trenchii]|uniref:Uncharacterized protein n=1 Tax=Durusdinium trenchii TaxID=1381693 RepID=A0ABP0L756_9DINO